MSRILGQLIIPVTNSTTSTTNTNTVNKPKLSTSEQKKVDTMQELIDKIKAAPTQSEKISLTNYLLEEVKDTTNNVFTNDDLFALLRDIFEPWSAEYEALALALWKRRVTTENICWDGIVEESESCDDGVNNWKIGYCSTDCLYASESQSDGLDSDTLNDDVTLVDLGVLDNAADKISSFVENGIDTLSGLASSVLDTYDTIITGFKDIVKANTSPEVQKILKKSLDVAQTVWKYTVVASAALLWSAWLALNFLIYKSAYTTYTVMSGDTMASIWNKFSMTDRALGAKNALWKNPTLKPGQKIRVKNRNLMEKDYLDQLKSVFNDELWKRKYGKMWKKIGDLFAKK